jgi:hypothetical protein
MAGGVDAVFHLLRAKALNQLVRPEEAATAMKSYVILRHAVAPPTASA